MEVHWMKLKKICAALLSAALLTSSFAYALPKDTAGNAGSTPHSLAIRFRSPQ